MPTPDPVLMPPREVERALLRHIQIAYPQFAQHDIAIEAPLPGVRVSVATEGDRGGLLEVGR